MKLNRNFKTPILFIALIGFGQIYAQNEFKLSKDHDAILVSDLDRAANFYSEVLGLKEIDNAGLGDRFRWFELNDHVQIHLILNPEDIQKSKNVHFSLNTDNLEGLIARLRAQKIYFENWIGEPDVTTTRPDGVKQIYFKDPDGYWIEVNDNKLKKL